MIKFKHNKTLYALILNVIICIVLCTIIFGCAGGQTLRGTNNDRSNKIEAVADVQFERMPWSDKQADTGPAVGILWGLWIFTILGCCLFLWKDKKQTK
jgi:hypothetical protein